MRGTFNKPVCYPVPHAYFQEAKELILEMETKGILEKARSSYASPITCVRKKNGRLRICGDFRVLNSITVPDHHPLPRIDYLKQVITDRSLQLCI